MDFPVGQEHEELNNQIYNLVEVKLEIPDPTDIQYELPCTIREDSQHLNAAVQNHKQPEHTIPNENGVESGLLSAMVNEEIGTKRKVRAGRVTRPQRERLLELVEANPRIHGQQLSGPAGHVEARKEWVGVAAELNTLGPEKNWIQWRTVWKEWKNKARSKNAALKKAMTRTGRGPPAIPLDFLEKRILAVIGQETPEDGEMELGLTEEAEMYGFSPASPMVQSPRLSPPRQSPRPSPPPSPENVRLSPGTEYTDNAVTPPRRRPKKRRRPGPIGPALDNELIRENTAAMEGIASAIKSAGEMVAEALLAVAGAIREKAHPPRGGHR